MEQARRTRRDCLWGRRVHGGGGREVDLIGAGSSEETTGVGSVGGGSSGRGGGLESTGGGRGGMKSNGVGGGDDMIEDAGFT
ncbi:PREDICTED: glycine-rich RNA-binding protein GRP2A-like [Tarenaya hassleriana]|uniref:glycine-rich RNA-binding protein GRP2A-like n=1 Tax=Tarenaya hassleriana TaxID=28532 RepID=UPI00053C1849|nr:PREDICTED: glycine-rich RNA-binding protein GRP2A-like [Tarenaya hassleriana]